MSGAIKNICNNLSINFIYKTSFDKANRTSKDSYRGILGEVRVNIYALELANEIFGNIADHLLLILGKEWDFALVEQILLRLGLPASFFNKIISFRFVSLFVRCPTESFSRVLARNTP